MRTSRARSAANAAGGLSWTYAALDWLFVASSAAADAMDRIGLARTQHAYAKVFRRFTRISVTHHLWPFHMLQSGLRLRFGLLLADRDLTLTRNWDGEFRVPCFYRSNVTLQPGQGRKFDHPPIINMQCAHDQVAVCGKSLPGGAGGAGSCPAAISVRTMGPDGFILSEALVMLLDNVSNVRDPEAKASPRVYEGVRSMRFDVDA